MTLKDLFPSLGERSIGKFDNRNLSYTKRGPGRKHNKKKGAMQ